MNQDLRGGLVDLYHDTDITIEGSLFRPKTFLSSHIMATCHSYIGWDLRIGSGNCIPSPGKMKKSALYGIYVLNVLILLRNGTFMSLSYHLLQVGNAIFYVL